LTLSAQASALLAACYELKQAARSPRRLLPQERLFPVRSQHSGDGKIVLGDFMQDDANQIRLDFQGLHYGIGHSRDQFPLLVNGSSFVHVDVNDRHGAILSYPDRLVDSMVERILPYYKESSVK
jgi:hypothetical protein